VEHPVGRGSDELRSKRGRGARTKHHDEQRLEGGRARADADELAVFAQGYRRRAVDARRRFGLSAA
jgi:hypothetical protein